MRLRGSIHVEYTLARLGAERLWDLLHDEPFVAALGALDRQPGRSASARGPQGDLPLGLAGRRRREHVRPMYPDQSLYPVDSVPNVVRRINAALLRADQIEAAEGKRDRYWIAPIIADAEAGFGGPLNALRAHEEHDRSGRRRRSLRGPAREREEVRPHGRQGARPDGAVHPHARRRAPRGRRLRRADDPRRAHRRRQREAHHERHRRARPPVHRVEGAHAGGLLPPEERRRDRHRARPRVRALRGHDLVRDVDARPRASEGRSPRASTSSSRTSSSRTTARPRSTGRRTSTTRRSPSSSESSARWATSSSSSRSPASTR